jgi:hypothetical protein
LRRPLPFAGKTIRETSADPSQDDLELHTFAVAQLLFRRFFSLLKYCRVALSHLGVVLHRCRRLRVLARVLNSGNKDFTVHL